jgi:hypothetical protein
MLSRTTVQAGMHSFCPNETVRRDMTPRHHPTPDEVLAIIVDEHRHQSQVDPEAEPEAVLTFDSSIAEWRLACDLLEWQGLGQALNEGWEMSLSITQWREILEPPRQRTLRTLCEAISLQAQIESLPERGLLGCRSQEGRALRTVRAVLLRLGMPRNEIRASTPIAPVLTRYGSRLLWPCVRLAPNALPPIKHVGRMHQLLVLTMLSLLLIGSALALLKLPLGDWSLCLALVVMLLLWIPHPLFRGSLVLPGITTLGELAACLGRSVRGESGVTPNGGPAAQPGNSAVTEGRPSVS